MEPERIELSFPDCQPGVLPLDDSPERQGMLSIAPPATVKPRIRANLGVQQLLGRNQTCVSPASGTGVTRTRIPAQRTRCLPFGRQPLTTPQTSVPYANAFWSVCLQGVWSRRESNAHYRDANAMSSRWTTTPKWSEWGILPSRPPVPETGALLSELHSVSRGDRRDLNSLDSCVHSARARLFALDRHGRDGGS